MINFDISEIVNEFSLSQEQAASIVEVSVKRVTNVIYENWLQTVLRSNLKTTKAQYARSILVAEEGRFAGSITLVGFIPNALEQGISGFDMKTGFLKSARIKRDKSGNPYITIPFRFGVSGGTGSFFQTMPKAVYNKAKKLEGSRTDLGGKRKTGGRITQNQLPPANRGSRTRAAFSIVSTKQTFGAYTSKTSIYAGMQRSRKTYESATQGQYNTFRRVSLNSDQNSWVHPGFYARNFADLAVKKTDVEKEVDFVVDNSLTELGF